MSSCVTTEILKSSFLLKAHDEFWLIHVRLGNDNKCDEKDTKVKPNSRRV